MQSLNHTNCRTVFLNVYNVYAMYIQLLVVTLETRISFLIIFGLTQLSDTCMQAMLEKMAALEKALTAVSAATVGRETVAVETVKTETAKHVTVKPEAVQLADSTNSTRSNSSSSNSTNSSSSGSNGSSAVAHTRRSSSTSSSSSINNTITTATAAATSTAQQQQQLTVQQTVPTAQRRPSITVQTAMQRRASGPSSETVPGTILGTVPGMVLGTVPGAVRSCSLMDTVLGSLVRLVEELRCELSAAAVRVQDAETTVSVCLYMHVCLGTV
jgi:cobalamin biosynthesis Mg chelatase CobN